MWETNIFTKRHFTNLCVANYKNSSPNTSLVHASRSSVEYTPFNGPTALEDVTSCFEKGWQSLTTSTSAVPALGRVRASSAPQPSTYWTTLLWNCELPNALLIDAPPRTGHPQCSTNHLRRPYTWVERKKKSEFDFVKASFDTYQQYYLRQITKLFCAYFFNSESLIKIIKHHYYLYHRTVSCKMRK